MKIQCESRQSVGLLLLGLAVVCQSAGPSAAPAQPTAMERAKAGKALWDEKCRTVAGENIYRTIDNVDGIVLLKVRPERGEREWADRMWPGAAFAHELAGDGYIKSFLLYERKSGPGRGHVDSPVTAYPGYRYVDIIDEKDGQRYRYTGSEKVVGRKDTNAIGVQMAIQKNSNYDLNVYRWTLDKTAAPDPAPRYGVTYEDRVIAEDRELGVASSTVKVLDLQTKEVLGEMTRYVWSPGPSAANPSPWLSAYKCGGEEVGSTTRFFADKVLIPKKEN